MPNLSTRRLAFIAGASVAGIVLLRVGSRVYRLLTHKEKIYEWLESVIPPSDYDYKQDTAASTDRIVKERHPELQDIADNGCLTILTKPEDFDRALPDELYILGTAHVSKKTANAVYKTIVAVEPDAVVVELCKSRAFMMYREVPPHMYEETPSKTAANVPPVTDNKDSIHQGSTTLPSVPDGKPILDGADSNKQGNSESSLPQQGLAKGLLKEVGVRTDSQIITDTVSGSQQSNGVSELQQQPGQSQPDGTSNSNTLATDSSSQPVKATTKEAEDSTQLQSQQKQTKQPHQVSEPTPSLTAVLIKALQQGSSPLQVLLSWAYMRLEAQLGTVAGLEFTRVRHALQDLAARKAQQTGSPALAEAAAQGAVAAQQAAPGGVQVYLGDVPLQRTVSRMWGVLNVRQKLRLLWALLRDGLGISAFDEAMLEALLQDDVLAVLQRELGADFPEMMGPLLHERNWHLAYTVHQAAQHGMKRIVLVVGRGHVPGVVYCLLHPYRSRKARREYRQGSSSNSSRRTSEDNAA